MFRLAAIPSNVVRCRGLIHLPLNTFVEAKKFFSTSTCHKDLVRGEIVGLTTYHKDWYVARVREAPKSMVKVVGVMPGLKRGATVEFKGEWDHANFFGKQFKAVSFIQLIQVGKYLEYFIPNIGPVLAARIEEKFGEDTIDVLSGKEMTRSLQEVDGIGKKLAASIQKDWQKQPAILWDVITRLNPLQPYICKRVVEKYKDKALSVIESNPYQLCKEVSGITFKTADDIALKMGIKPDSPLRVGEGLLFELEKAQKDGHTAITVPNLVEATRKMLALEKDDEFWDDGIDQLALCGDVKLTVRDGLQYLQLTILATAEEDIAAFLNRARPAKPIFDGKTIKEVEKQLGLSFSDSQKEAINSALSSQVTVLTGGPGTGKTAICQALVEILKDRDAGMIIHLAAPTGKAAKRLTEATGYDATTIHRLLKCDKESKCFAYHENNKLPADFIIIDEASMLDTHLTASLIRAIPDDCHLVLVGDVDQLPSIGPGNVLHDIITSERVPVTRLKSIFRQSQDSSIVTYSHAVKRGDQYIEKELLCSNVSDLSECREFQFVDLQKQECSSMVEEVYNFVRKLGRDPINDMQILAPMYERSSGINALNEMFQKLNPATTSIRFSNDREFKLGDKVMQTRNDYEKEIFNGAVGFVSKIGNEVMAVNFDGIPIEYRKSDLDDLTLAYAISIHKSQGSEYPIVVVVLTKDHNVMLQRKLLYTALARGKEYVIVVGDQEAYEKAVKNDFVKERCTLLCHLLSQ